MNRKLKKLTAKSGGRSRLTRTAQGACVVQTAAAPASPAGTVPVGLNHLDTVELTGEHARLYAEACANCHGSAPYRRRKLAEALDLYRLAQIAPYRLSIVQCNLEQTMTVAFYLHVAVPCRQDDGQVVVQRAALLAMRYPEEAMRLPVPGTEFLTVLMPRPVWLANVHISPTEQRMCLGTQPAGVRCVELVLAAYDILRMRVAALDERDPQGIFNAEAVFYWQQNRDRIPLTKTPFLRDESAAEATRGSPQ